MAPVDNSPANNMCGFEHICSVNSNDLFLVHQYKSTNTGITVYIADVEGPIVNGYFTIVTEAHDDDGLPHTLEHLIFLGSEKHPYKGVLDLLANRCLASGTNAFTDTDHTCYTMETIGSEGFLTLMPIYLEHILYPTLKDSAFHTEVYHVNGNGEDAGVVYSEMLAIANVGENLAYREMVRLLYPGHCGYKSETGGDLKCLRESTTNEKVKNYHKKYYRPENLHIIITGQVKHADVFKALQPLEEEIISKGDLGSFERPWQSPVPPFTDSVEKIIEYPCNDEDNGLVDIGWRGPSVVKNRYDLLGISLLLKYLTDTSASPLQQEFVEINDPFANDVKYHLIENSESVICLIFENVPKAKSSLIKENLLAALKKIENSEEGIDMQRMNIVLHRHILEILSNLESMPHDTIGFMLNGNVLYGNNQKDLEERLNEVASLNQLKKEPLSYWKTLLNNYLLKAPFVLIEAMPSIKKLEELTESEKIRIENRKKDLGSEGLKKKDEELQKAISENDKPIPNELLASIKIPSIDSINFHEVKKFNAEALEQHPKMDLQKLPLYTYLDHLNTNFIYIFVFMDTTGVPSENKAFIPLILESILETPVIRKGQLIPYEQVVNELESDTIAVSTRLGIEASSRFSCGSYGHNAMLALQVELSKYEKGIEWIKEILYQTKLTPDRLKIISSKIINDVAQMKRRGEKIIGDLVTGLTLKKDSTQYKLGMLRQQKLLTTLIKQLEDESEREKVLKQIESVRNILTAPENMALYLAVNVDKLSAQISDLYKPWENFFKDDKTVHKKSIKLIQDYEFMTPLPDIPIQGCITNLGCIESAFLLQCCPSLKDYSNPDLAPLSVCLQYLTQLEGPIWKQVRGPGFVYSYDLYLKPNEGLLYLLFYRASNTIAAFKEVKSILEKHLNKSTWDSMLLESAKSSLIFKITNREKSIGATVIKSVLNHFRNLPYDSTKTLIQQISCVTMDDIRRISQHYLKDLFNPVKCKTAVLCHTSKADEISSSFKSMNYELKIYNSLEESYLCSS